MKKWLVIVSGLLLVLAIGMVGYLGVFGSSAPWGLTYYGKPLAEWFRPWRSVMDSMQLAADIELPQPSRGDFNPEALPVLVRHLQYRHSIWTRLCGWVWHAMPIPAGKRSLLPQPVPESWIQQDALGLLRLSKYNAPACVPVLIEQYQKANPSVRVLLAGVLAELGAPAAEALPVLRASLRAQDPAERAAAKTAIAQIEKASNRQSP